MRWLVICVGLNVCECVGKAETYPGIEVFPGQTYMSILKILLVLCVCVCVLMVCSDCGWGHLERVQILFYKELKLSLALAWSKLFVNLVHAMILHLST